MDLKAYFKRLRQVEAELSEDHVVIASLPTPDGGKAGALTEAPRSLAAKMIVEGSARLATEPEAGGYREGMAESRRLAEKKAAAGRIQVVLVPEQTDDGRQQKLRLVNSKA